MPDEDHSTEVARSELRASHDDRDKVVEQLRVAAGDGRLTAEELDQRLELALRARTYGELAKLVVDLPAASAAALAGTAAKPKDLIRIDCRSGHAKRDGRWIVPQRMEVKVTSGSVVLDFTEAVIAAPMLRISAEVRSGHLRLITKPGIVVDADDVAVRSGHIRVKSPWRPDIPEVLRVEISGKVGSGEIKARPPFRSFWAWLTRQPRPYELMRG
ncbi:MAG TPA: DUF1707 domain-containing protein [Streptosporangiaceae bacterium]|nr:DUF1707 domain-containing protein [Streptosporangiaceae bacterium]